MRQRRALIPVAAATFLAVLASAPAADATPSPSASAAKPALYGTADPAHDGVWRQSYALLALRAARLTPAHSTTVWLTSQQCADGGFLAYRPDTSAPCDPQHEDTNATGIALQAFAAIGREKVPTAKATTWLKSAQNPDGGWPHTPGGASEPDSTGVAIGGLKAAHLDPATVTKNGKTPYDALRAFQAGCAAKPADRGSYGLSTQGKLTASAKATADAVLGGLGATFTVKAPKKDSPAKAPHCAAGTKDAYATLDPTAAADAGAAYLTAQLTAGGDHFTAVTSGSAQPAPDYGTTADAVVALAAGGRLTAAKSAYAWLAANSAAGSQGNPTALSQLILAAHATGADPRAAGGTDLVKQLVALGPAPAKAAHKAAKKKKVTHTRRNLAIVGGVIVVGAGAYFVLRLRKKRQG
jgi:hypothetical protein